MLQKLIISTILLGLPWIAPSLAQAQAYPNNMVKIIVPYPAGGGVDFVGRTVSQRLSKIWGQPVTIENKSGASGSIGADYVAKSKPDGLTLVLASPAEVLVGPIAGQKTSYDPQKDLIPVVLVGETPLGVVAHPSIAGSNLGEALANSKKSGKELSYGTPGNGSSMHFAGEAIQEGTNTPLNHIPYRGAAPAVNDVLGNQVNMAIVGLPPTVAHIKAGNMKLLAVTTMKRSPAFPDAPSIAEIPGLKGYRFSNWMLLLAPAGTPNTIVNKIAQDTNKVLSEPDIKKKLEEAGVDGVGLTGADLNKFLGEERARYTSIAKSGKIKFSE
nr:tripartite tricarboxylate transporter substrate-binding protein [uncultured Polynucleobacter sp.]